MEIEQIEQKAQAESGNLEDILRKEVKAIMEKWAEISSCGVFIQSCTYFLYAGQKYRLTSDTKEIKTKPIDGASKISYDKSFWNILDANQLFEFIELLPEMIEEAAEKMKRKNVKDLDIFPLLWLEFIELLPGMIAEAVKKMRKINVKESGILMKLNALASV